MGKFLVAGLVNEEATVKVPSLPVAYTPITYSSYEIGAGVSGGAYNIGKALRVLGDEVRLISFTGKDRRSRMVMEQLKEDGISLQYLLQTLHETPQSVILYENSGERQIFCDLKEVQEAEYDKQQFLEALEGADMAVIQNSNFCRPFLKEIKKKGKGIAANVHALCDSKDKYNKDFMEYADILFISDNQLEGDRYDFLEEIKKQYQNKIIILGCGAKGVLLFVREDQFIGHFPAVKTREIVNILGAGDALFSAFIHFYQKTRNPYYSIKNAILFSSYKIGTAGSANGFMTEAQLEQYYPIIWK